MQIRWKAGLLTSVVCLASGPMAPAPQAAQEQSCAHVRQINNFRYVDGTTAIFETGPHRQFKVTFNGQCRDLKWASSVRVEARPGICLRPGDVVIVGSDGTIPERCIVRAVEAVAGN